jgi:hypothetical protein
MVIIARFCVLVMVFAVSPNASAQEQADLHKWSGNGLKIELSALGLDQVRAFFIGREFSAEDADFIANTGCIFRSAIGNAGEKPGDTAIVIELKKWRILHNGQVSAPKTREAWAKVWQSRGVTETPKIAFHWGLFPTNQRHQPTDYNWGLISFDLPPGKKFDLELHWSLAGIEQSHMLKNLECGK